MTYKCIKRDRGKRNMCADSQAREMTKEREKEEKLDAKLKKIEYSRMNVSRRKAV